jgi:DNA ligase (NAD+)
MEMRRDEKHLYEQARQLLQTDAGAVEETIAQLREVINFADWKYYVESEPVLADVEYDTLFARLKKLEQEYPEHITPDSPTQRIAMGLSEKFPAVRHLVPMLSLENTYNAEDLRDWDRRCKEYAGDAVIEYCVEPKYDGASISLIYEKGQLVRGATRGDGIMGEEITTNIRQIRSVPLSAPFAAEGLSQIEIRGEVVIDKEVFATFNEQRAKEGLPPLANPRNAASGTLRMLNPEEVRKRRLSAILYHISDYTLEPGKDMPAGLHNHYDALSWLYRCGFPTPVKEMRRFRTIDEVIAFCGEFETRRDDLPYEVDGLVIKVNDFILQERMGMTSHHPRWAVAYKFRARQATSRLERVEFQVGRTGTITPVAKIEPVPIGGVTVSSVSLFNEDVVREKDLYIGDTVLVERAGDVIPYIVKAMPELRDGSEQPIRFPTHCPECEQPLERPEEEAVWRCINISCPAQVVERIIHFCSKDAMDIRGMGASNVKKFYELGILSDIPGLYHIDWERVRTLEGFGEKSVTNLQQAIEHSKQQPLHRVIFGLGIRHVGETMAKTLAAAVGHIRDLYEWNEEKLVALEDVGPKVAASILHFFHTPENRHMIDLLEQEGVNLSNQHQGKVAADGTLAGMTFLFTGTLSHFKRSDAEAMVEERGGTILSGVSSKLNYLVVGADAGSKLEKAKKLGTVQILSEEAFLELIGRSSA